MSNKPPATSLKPEGKPALTPELRFPDFRDAKGWEEKEIGDVYQVTRGDVLSMKLVQDSKTAETPYPVYSSQTKSNGLSGFYSDFLFEDAITWTTDGANAGDVNFRPGRFYCTNVCGVLLNSGGFANKCIAALINSVSRKYVSYVGNPKLMNGVMSKIKIPFPSVAEQRKIADCLSSVDELIAAQARKLDALKTHKKGLMKQLFPREGETQPRLRFPEFRNAEEWSKERLGSLCFRIMDGTHFSPKSKGGPRPYLTSKNIKDGRIDLSNLSYISEEEHLEIYNKCPVKLHDVLLTKDGANTGNCALNNLEYEFSLLSSVAVLRSDPSKLCQEFLFQSLLSDSVQSLISDSMSGQAITRITLTKIGGFVISVTSLGEQQRIAEFLASLDDLVATQTQKLDALKTHKKGLMQQLFPSPEVVEA